MPRRRTPRLDFHNGYRLAHARFMAARDSGHEIVCARAYGANPVARSPRESCCCQLADLHALELVQMLAEIPWSLLTAAERRLMSNHGHKP